MGFFTKALAQPLLLAAAVASLWWAPDACAASLQESLRERVETCAACHGADGNSALEKIPSLAGQPEFFTMNQLILMREGVRPVEAMAAFVKDLKDDDIVALAGYFAQQPPKRTDEALDPARVKAGEALSTQLRCASCHLPSLGGHEQMPRLAGQRVDYMFDAMKAYRDNTRAGADTQMSAVVYGLSDAQIDALAHYAASR